MLYVNGSEILNDDNKASALSSQYASVFTVDNGECPEFEMRMPPDSLNDVLITDRLIIEAIHHMNGNSAPGMDNIHPIFVKNVFPFLIKPLRLIFTKSFQTGIVPVDWTRGLICPIYKNNGRPNDCSSYRPICLTSIICRLFEYIVRKQMLEYFIGNNLLSPSQHGFLPKRSTCTNMLSCLNDWTKFLNDGKCFDVIYIDLAKAFDTVSHSKLLQKLCALGVGGCLLRWLRKFLVGRVQSVRVGTSISSAVPVMSGIPQGTILGPLLFLLYVNDLPDTLATSNSNLILYADDSKLYWRTSSTNECLLLASDLLSLEEWFSRWQLTVNISKCEVLNVGFDNSMFPFRIGNHIMPQSSSCKDLGIHVSRDLSSSKHCTTISNFAHFKCRQFYRSFACKDRDFLLFLFTTYIRPILESSSPLWSPHLVSDINTVEGVQRKFTKYLPGLFDVSYPERLRILNLESLELRRLRADLILLYKIVHKMVDIDFDTLFSFNSNSTSHKPQEVTH